MNVPRFFLAVPVAGMAARRLRAQAVRHREPLDRIVDRRDLHVTIHFFGACNPFRLRRVVTALDPRALPAAFAVRFATIGPFAPTRGRHLVALPDASSSRRLQQLYDATITQMRAVAPSWFPRHRYLPHATLARTRPQTPSRRDRRAGALLRVTHIALYRSGTRSHSAPRYDILRQWRLRTT